MNTKERSIILDPFALKLFPRGRCSIIPSLHKFCCFLFWLLLLFQPFSRGEVNSIFNTSLCLATFLERDIMKKEGGYSRNSFLLLTHHQWIAVLVAIVCHRSRIQGLPIHGHPCIRGSYVNHRSSVLARIHYQRCTHSPSSSSSDSMYLRKSQRRHPSCSATVASIDGPWRDDIFQTYWNEQPLLIRQAFAAQKKKEEEKEKDDESTITKLVAILDTTTAPITWESMMDLANQGRGGVDSFSTNQMVH